jgi:hypothetical protein
MPRPAAALLGIALIAVSIGFNMTQYPKVWEMVGPAPAGGSASSLSALSSDVPPGKAIAPLPTSFAAVPPRDAAEQAPTTPANAGMEKTQTEKTATGQDQRPIAAVPPSVETENPSKAEKMPLTPVSFPSASAAPANNFAADSGIRRLPPVDQITPNPNGSGIPRRSDGSIPIYPSTGY